MRNRILIWVLLLTMALSQTGCIGEAFIITSIYKSRKINRINAEKQKQKIEERKNNGR